MKKRVHVGVVYHIGVVYNTMQNDAKQCNLHYINSAIYNVKRYKTVFLVTI
jgi:hypothetical protein